MFQDSELGFTKTSNRKVGWVCENAIKNCTVELPLPTDDIMDLLNLCLTSTYIQYSSKNNYNTDFVRRNTNSNTDSNIQTNSGPVTTATMPYIRGTYCTYIRTLQYTCCTQTDNHFTATDY